MCRRLYNTSALCIMEVAKFKLRFRVLKSNFDFDSSRLTLYTYCSILALINWQLQDFKFQNPYCTRFSIVQNFLKFKVWTLILKYWFESSSIIPLALPLKLFNNIYNVHCKLKLSNLDSLTFNHEDASLLTNLLTINYISFGDYPYLYEGGYGERLCFASNIYWQQWLQV
jgi:hypothetical protein